MELRLIGRAVGWGLITPLVVGAMFLVLTQLARVNALFEWPIKDLWQLILSFEWPIKDPYQLIFAIGIICSLWAQSTITCYFDDRDFFQSTKLSKAVEKSLRFEIPLILGGLVLISLMSLDYFNTHIVTNLLYLIIVAAFDLFYWRNATARDGDKEFESEQFKECCRQLFWRVDLVLLLSIAISFIFVLLVPASLPPFSVDTKALSLPSDIAPPDLVKLAESINGQWSGRGPAFPEHMKHIFMSGVIGVLLLLTVMLIFIHLCEWEIERAAASSAADCPCATDPPGPSGGSHDPAMASAIEMHRKQQSFLRRRRRHAAL